MFGLTISLEKSTVYLAGVYENDRETMLSQCPFESGSLPVRYLGLLLMTKRMTSNDYAPLVERIRKRVTPWTARQLSFAGRVQLINTVIHNLTNFWMSVYKLPKRCIKEIDQICASFLWSGPSLNSKKAKIAWHDVFTPKEEGGLGIRSLEEANNVCCLKLVWRILSSKSLWVRWVDLYLIRKSSFWQVDEKSTLGS